MTKVRCAGCRKLFAQGLDGNNYRLEVECPRCGRLNVYEAGQPIDAHAMIKVVE